MHIRQITLSNFRSFRAANDSSGRNNAGNNSNAPVLSAGTNCIVGRNGSGKSNWMDAIQFCLVAGPFAHLRQEERQSLLHEGSGSAAVNAYVEIVLDNTDQRLILVGGQQTTTADTVVIRRTIGLKKDEFFLQRQRCTKQEILSLLEGAGFSKQNPYYIVQQGQVQSLCTLTDRDRLALLQQVAGTVVYDEKKQDSLAQMHENQTRLTQVETLLQSMQDRLTELERETQELKEYQTLDRQRKAVEYALYEKEAARARNALQQVQDDRQHQQHVLLQLQHQAKACHDDIQQAQATVRDQSSTLQRAEYQVQTAQRAHQTVQTQRTALSVQLQSQREAQLAFHEEQQALHAELQEVEAKLHNVQQRAAKAQEPLAESQALLAESNRQHTDVQGRLQALYAKQGRSQQFASVAQRDAYLQTQIQELENSRAEKEAQIHQATDDLANLRRKVQSMTQRHQQLSTQVMQQQAQLQQVSKNLPTAQQELTQAQTERLDARKEVDFLQQRVRQSAQELSQSRSNLFRVMPRATAHGWQALPRLVQELRLQEGTQYFGTVLQNLELVDPKYASAVEVAAQNTLWHVIVDTDETASRLLTLLQDRQLGRVTFLPLSQLRVPPVHTRPNLDAHDGDVQWLINVCVKFDARVTKAMQHVLGTTLLARSTAVAADASKQYHTDAVTLEGDLCSRQGAVTGGYRDVGQSRIRAYQARQKAQEEHRKSQAEFAQAQERAQQNDQKAVSHQQALQRMQAQQRQLQHVLDQRQEQRKQIENEQKLAQDSISKTEGVLEHAKEEEKTLVSELQRCRDELGTAIVSELSIEEQEELAALKVQQTELADQCRAQKDQVARYQMDSQKHQVLTDKLTQRKAELEQQLAATQVDQDQEALEQGQEALNRAQSSFDEAQERLSKAQEEHARCQEDLQESKQYLDGLRQQDVKIAKNLQEAQDKAERLLNKRSMCMSKRETYQRKLQELGSLPPASELEPFAHQSIQKLMKDLESIQKKLKKYATVNKKAFDQYVNFREQREALLQRKAELDSGARKVQELVESLDRQKDEAINRTFRGVSSHFQDVFKELVPLGSGELILRTAMDDDEEDETRKPAAEEEDDDDTSANTSGKASSKGKAKSDGSDPDVSMFRGVSIRVRFSAVGENYLMSQLSGGQKTLVALALIFAIQRCDPAPFYILDELDQALDSTYRSAVANLIQRQASNKENPTQFIVSTFRPELVTVANRCFGISHQNKVSSMHPLSKRDALNFVANLLNEEEAVGEVRSVATKTAVSSQRSLSLASTKGKKRKALDNVPEEEE